MLKKYRYHVTMLVIVRILKYMEYTFIWYTFKYTFIWKYSLKYKDKLSIKFQQLIKTKMLKNIYRYHVKVLIIVGILKYMSTINFMLS